MGLLLVVSLTIALIVAGLLALLFWAIQECRHDRWLANLMHHQRAEWTRGVDLPRWKLPKERG